MKQYEKPIVTITKFEKEVIMGPSNCISSTAFKGRGVNDLVIRDF